MKKCSNCKAFQKIDNFVTNGREYKTCNHCRRVTDEYKAAHSEHIKQYNQKWYYTNIRGKRDFNTLDGQIAIATEMLQSARSRATKKGIPFQLKINDILPLPEFCPVLGIKLDYQVKGKSNASPSLDRIDNDQGYTPENTLLVSRKVNTIKNNATVKELIKIADFYGSRTISLPRREDRSEYDKNIDRLCYDLRRGNSGS